MTNKKIYIIVGSLIGVALLVWLISSFSKKDNSGNGDNTGNSGGGGTGDGFTWDFNFGGDDEGNVDYSGGIGGTGTRVDYGDRYRGVNTYESPNYADENYLSMYHRGFNIGDGTAPRGELVPLSKRRTSVYVAPNNQNGGTIKNF